MQAYTGFAQVYDIFMDNVPYDNWTEYLTGLLQEYGVKDGLVLELGCGTGKVTRRLALKGYDMIGIDLSDEMLEIAREKEYSEDSWTEAAEPEGDLNGRNPILYLQQDMREFELFGTVNAVVSICDSMNYITSEEDLIKVFQLVNNYLDPGGLFIFDMNTEYKYKNLLGDATIAENREDCSFIWENYYDEENRMNEYNMTIFVKAEEETEEEEMSEEDMEDVDTEEADQGEANLKESKRTGTDFEDTMEEDYEAAEVPLFLRFQETHYQKVYSIPQVVELLGKAGLEFIAVYDAFTRCSPKAASERVYFIAREKYQENKKYI